MVLLNQGRMGWLRGTEDVPCSGFKVPGLCVYGFRGFRFRINLNSQGLI